MSEIIGESRDGRSFSDVSDCSNNISKELQKSPLLDKGKIYVPNKNGDGYDEVETKQHTPNKSLNVESTNPTIDRLVSKLKIDDKTVEIGPFDENKPGEKTNISNIDGNGDEVVLTVQTSIQSCVEESTVNVSDELKTPVDESKAELAYKDENDLNANRKELTDQHDDAVMGNETVVKNEIEDVEKQKIISNDEQPPVDSNEGELIHKNENDINAHHNIPANSGYDVVAADIETNADLANAGRNDNENQVINNNEQWQFTNSDVHNAGESDSVHPIGQSNEFRSETLGNANTENAQAQHVLQEVDTSEDTGQRRLVKIENESEHQASYVVKTALFPHVNTSNNLIIPVVDPTKNNFIHQFPENSRVSLDPGVTAYLVTTRNLLYVSAYSEDVDQHGESVPIWLNRKLACPHNKVTHLKIKTRHF